MSTFLGADTDELRRVATECQKAAKTADEAIVFLTALILILEAASFWTGGASAAYAAYLKGTVIPWLRKVSMALHLFAQVLGANAEAQDRVSAGESVDFSTLPRYQTPTLPSSSTSEGPTMSWPGTGSSNVGTPQLDPGASSAGTATTGTGPRVDVPDAVSPGAARGSDGFSVGSSSVDGGLGAGAAGGVGGGSGSGVGSGSDGGSGAFGSGGGVDGSTSGTTPGDGTTYSDGGDPSTYSGDWAGLDGAAAGTGLEPAAGTGDVGSGGYAAAGAAGLLGLGGAGALAAGGRGQGHTSPDGFDYNRIKGLKTSPYVTDEFLRKTEAIAGRLGCKPEDLLAVMSFETGGSFSPGQRNNAGGSATGLIQFMPDTAKGLGTTTAALARMSGVEQLDYVERYFGNQRYTSVEQLYSKVLAGHRISDPDGVLFRQAAGRAGRSYRANSGVDLNHDGMVTVREAASLVRNRIMATPAR